VIDLKMHGENMKFITSVTIFSLYFSL